MWLLHCTWLSELADGFESRVWRRALPPLCLLPVQKSQSSIRSAVCPHFPVPPVILLPCAIWVVQKAGSRRPGFTDASK